MGLLKKTFVKKNKIITLFRNLFVKKPDYKRVFIFLAFVLGVLAGFLIYRSARVRATESTCFMDKVDMYYGEPRMACQTEGETQLDDCAYSKIAVNQAACESDCLVLHPGETTECGSVCNEVDQSDCEISSESYWSGGSHTHCQQIRDEYERQDQCVNDDNYPPVEGWSNICDTYYCSSDCLQYCSLSLDGSYNHTVCDDMCSHIFDSRGDIESDCQSAFWGCLEESSNSNLFDCEDEVDTQFSGCQNDRSDDNYDSCYSDCLVEHPGETANCDTVCSEISPGDCEMSADSIWEMEPCLFCSYIEDESDLEMYCESEGYPNPMGEISFCEKYHPDKCIYDCEENGYSYCTSPCNMLADMRESCAATTDNDVAPNALCMTACEAEIDYSTGLEDFHCWAYCMKSTEDLCEQFCNNDGYVSGATCSSMCTYTESDSDSPDITLDSDIVVSSSPGYSLTGSATDATGIASIEYRTYVDQVLVTDWTACTCDDGTCNETAEDFTCGLTSLVDRNLYYVEVRGTDSASPSNTTSSDFDNAQVQVDVQSDLKAWWAMEVDTSLVDSSGNGHNGTIVRDPSVQIGHVENALNWSIPTEYSYANLSDSSEDLSFSGADKAFTVDAWVKANNFTTLANHCRIVSKVNTAGDENTWAMGIAPGGGLYCAYWRDGFQRATNTTVKLTNDQWNHISCTWSNSEIVASIAGVVQETLPYDGHYIDASTHDVNVASRANGEYSYGMSGQDAMIDNIRIFENDVPDTDPPVLDIPVNNSFVRSLTTSFDLQGSVTDVTGVQSVQYDVEQSGTFLDCTCDDGACDEISEDFTCAIAGLTPVYTRIRVRATDSAPAHNQSDLTSLDIELKSEPTADLVGWWKFESDTEIVDSVKFAYNATIVGSLESNDGYVNDALDFSSDYAVVPNTNDTLTFSGADGDFRAEAWVKKDNFTGGWRRVVGQMNTSGTENTWLLGVDTDGGIYCAIWSGGSEYSISTVNDGIGAEGLLVADDWNHIGCNWIDNQLTAVVNDTSVMTKDFSGHDIDSSEGDLVIGAKGGGSNSYDGVIDEIKIHKGGDDDESSISSSFVLGGTGMDAASVIDYGVNGETVLSGSFSENIDFDFTSGTDYHSNVNHDMYITVSNSGNYLWTRTIRALSGDDASIYQWGLDVDEDNDIFVVGQYYADSVDFNGGGGTDIRTNQGSADGYITKYDIDGNYIWTVSLASSGHESLTDVVSDSDGDIVVNGSFGSNSLDFDPDPDNTVTHSHNGGTRDAFLAKYSADGEYIWSRTWGGDGIDKSYNLSLDPDDNIYVVGCFMGTDIDFDPDPVGTDLHSSNGSTDIYVSKFDSDGDHLWTATFGTANTESGWGVAYDNLDIDKGNVYVGGRYFDYVVDESTLGSSYQPWGVQRALVYKFDANNGSLVWYKEYESQYGAMISDVVADEFGNVYYCGSYDEDNILLGKIYGNGVDAWINVLEGEGTGRDPDGWGFDWAREMALVDGDKFLMTGRIMSESLDFDPTSGTDIRGTNGYVDGFKVEYNDYTKFRINPDVSISVIDEDRGADASISTRDFQGFEHTINVKDSVNDNQIADVEVDVFSNLDWTDASADSDMDDGKAFFHYPGGITNLPGSSQSSYSLYIPIPDGWVSSSVVVCPDADEMSDLSQSCPGAVVKTTSDADANIVIYEGHNYWKIDGVTGTGGVSLFNNFALRDTLSRLEVNVDSTHTIEFGTINGLLASGDTMELEFDPSGQNWDLSGLTWQDIDLADDGTDLTLGAAAGADIWGVAIDSVNDTVTFTAPTSGTSYIAVDSNIVIEIGSNATYQSTGTNLIGNPATVGDYELRIEITNITTETGEVEIPIVDDDTINVTSYLDTVLTFDIDTASTNVNCDAVGGVSPCDSHSGVGDNVGYVIDLGEMVLTSVSKSGDTVLHSDGISGNINYIWFDLESNADGGVVVTVVSSNERLQMDASNWVPSVATGSEQQITAADGLYGANHRSSLINSATQGSLIIHDDCDCDGGDDYYCDLQDGGTPVEVFNSNNNPVDDGRVQWAIGVAPDASDGTGTYTDQLTFIAAATF